MQPGYSGGLENTFSYKGLSLTVFFQFVKQQSYNYLFGIYAAGAAPGMHANMPTLVEERWKKPGDISEMQRASTGIYNDAGAAVGYFQSSTGIFGDASFVRLKTLAVSYDFPERIVKKAGMENFRLYANIQNLLTFTAYKFGDPETPGAMTFPLQKIIAVGLMFNF